MSTPPIGKYVYGVVAADAVASLTVNSPGIYDKLPVRTVVRDDLAVVVSDAALQEYEQSRRNMVAHSRVLEEVLAQTTVLPMRFGVVAPNEAALATHLLHRQADSMRRWLRELDGMLEVGLRAFWQEGLIFDEVLREEEAIRELRDSLMGKSPDATYYERIKLGEMVEAAVTKRRDRDAERILTTLRPIAHDWRINRTVTDRMVVNAAFLVARERQPEMLAAIDAVDATTEGRMLFKVVQAAPPYNFVTLTVNWEGA